MNQLIKNKIVTSCWIAAGVATIVLLGAASRIKNHHACSGINVEIKNSDELAFIGKDDILDLVNKEGLVIGKDIKTINLFAMENMLKQDKWIKDVQLFFDNKNVLEVYIKQREPIARMFCLDNTSFYIDAVSNRLPLTNKASTRVLIVTGFTNSKDTLSTPDSMLLTNTVKLVNKLVSDSFWNAQIAQVNITSKATYELVPSMGNHLIEFGTADSIDTKLRKLKAFYKNVFYVKDMSAYAKLNVEFDNQIVATKASAMNMVDTTDAPVDTALTTIATKTAVVDTVIHQVKAVNENKNGNKMKISGVKQNKSIDNTLSPIRTSVHNKDKPKKQLVPKALMKEGNE